MSHFYNCKEEPFLTEANTPSQAKKVDAYPSVTTVMRIIKDPFLDEIWSPKKYVELARQDESYTMHDIERLKYGMRVSPIDGSEVTASQFGISVHNRLEAHTNNMADDIPLDLSSAWDDWAIPFVDYIKENNITPIASEFITWNKELRVAGSVDFIGKHTDGKFFLADYKCRDCKGRGGKFYEKKDCTQLAIESYMLAKMWNLNYLPEAISVCIDIVSKKHYNKLWTTKQMEKGIKRFKLAAEIYWMDFMNEE